MAQDPCLSSDSPIRHYTDCYISSEEISAPQFIFDCPQSDESCPFPQIYTSSSIQMLDCQEEPYFDVGVQYVQSLDGCPEYSLDFDIGIPNCVQGSDTSCDCPPIDIFTSVQMLGCQDSPFFDAVVQCENIDGCNEYFIDLDLGIPDCESSAEACICPPIEVFPTVQMLGCQESPFFNAGVQCFNFEDGCNEYAINLDIGIPDCDSYVACDCPPIEVFTSLELLDCQESPFFNAGVQCFNFEDGCNEYAINLDIGIPDCKVEFIADIGTPALHNGGWCYPWVEQTMDPLTGEYIALIAGRSGNGAVSPFMYELNGNYVDTPTFVVARLRGVFGGSPIYDFDRCCSNNCNIPLCHSTDCYISNAHYGKYHTTDCFVEFDGLWHQTDCFTQRQPRIYHTTNCFVDLEGLWHQTDCHIASTTVIIGGTGGLLFDGEGLVIPPAGTGGLLFDGEGLVIPPVGTGGLLFDGAGI